MGFMFLVVLGIGLSFSTGGWIPLWVGMEFSTFFFLPYMLGIWSLPSSIICFKYFLFQSIGSALFIFSMFKAEKAPFTEFQMASVTNLLVLMSLMIKLGIFPFQGWLFHLCENLSWEKFFLLTSIQEIIPIIAITKLDLKFDFLIFFLILSMSMMVFLAYAKMSIRWMVMISSLFNINWMILASLTGKETILYFFLVYFSILWFFYLFFLGKKVKTSYLLDYKNKSKYILIFFCFNLMGVPPLGMFLAKTEVISTFFMVDSTGILLLLAVFFSSLIMVIYIFFSFSIFSFSKGILFSFSQKSLGKSLFFIVFPFLVWVI